MTRSELVHARLSSLPASGRAQQAGPANVRSAGGDVGSTCSAYKSLRATRYSLYDNFAEKAPHTVRSFKLLSLLSRQQQPHMKRKPPLTACALPHACCRGQPAHIAALYLST